MESVREILKKIRRLEVRTRGRLDTAMAGQYRSVFKGRGMNFEEVREYQPGDEVRAIDWNVTARLGEVRGDAFVKKFTEERELTLMTLVDISGSMSYGSTVQSKRELAAEVASLLAFSATRNNDQAGLLLCTGEVELFLPPRKGRGHVLRLIREVLYFQPRGRETRLEAGLEYLHRVLPHRAVVFLISDFHDLTLSRTLRAISRQHDVVAITIVDAAEENLPAAGRVTLEDPETGAQMEIDTSSRAIQRQVRERVAARQAEQRAVWRRCGIDQVELRTGEDYVPALRAFFRQRAHRQSLPA